MFASCGVFWTVRNAIGTGMVMPWGIHEVRRNLYSALLKYPAFCGKSRHRVSTAYQWHLREMMSMMTALTMGRMMMIMATMLTF